MEVDTRSLINAFNTKILCILFIIFQLSNLVICGDPNDSLENALEFVERRQRDLQLQENEYFGQPEDIGYGYQKNFGIFENGPARELGSPDSNPEGENDFRNILYNYANLQGDGDLESPYMKQRSSFSERYAGTRKLPDEKGGENHQDGIGNDLHCSYMQHLKDLWSKYRQSKSEDFGIEDLTPGQVSEILSSLYDKEPSAEDFFDASSDESRPDRDSIYLRSRRNYRVFDRLSDRRKRYPSFGEGFYGKRTGHSQHINYETPPENEFLYALKFVNPDMNREAVENLKESGYEILGDEKDRDVIRLLNDPAVGPEEEPNWPRIEEPYEKDIWLPGPVSFATDDSEQEVFDNDKRAGTRIFKQHHGIHLNSKRMPVKRSSTGLKIDDKTTKEVKSIFDGSQQSTTEAPRKKETTKKPTETIKKLNGTKPEVTRHRDAKKLVRRANDYTKERAYSDNSEIEKIFGEKKSVIKKSIDWSQYFGFDKRSQQWLKDDYIRRAENHFLSPKSKRFISRDIGINLLDKSQYDEPFDTRFFNNKKKITYNVDRNIDKMERKLGNIEDKIIDDAVKYTGAHTGDATKDLKAVKNEIVHHLEAAYSLEKMKNALEEFRNSMKSEKTFLATEKSKMIGTDSPKTDAHGTIVRMGSAKTDESKTRKSKRVSTKKEIEDVYGKERLEFLNWPQSRDVASSSPFDGSEECPVLEKSLNNCLRVDEISGRFADLLLPICSLQQICYFCGSEIGFSKPSACDMMYLTEAENLCQGNRACLLSARDSMLALRDLHEQDLMSGSHVTGSCLSNSCIQKYFLNNPAAIVPLEYQN